MHFFFKIKSLPMVSLKRVPDAVRLLVHFYFPFCQPWPKALIEIDFEKHLQRTMPLELRISDEKFAFLFNVFSGDNKTNNSC